MLLDQIKLLAALIDPAITPLSDADAATALSAKVLTPRGSVTWATLSNAAVWGITKTAAFRAWLGGKITDPTIGPVCQIVADMLGGVGFDANDPQSGVIAGQLVAAGAPIVQDDATIALNTISYRCGDVIQASDVTAARAEMSRLAGWTAIDGQRADVWNAAYALNDARIAKIQAGRNGTASAPGDLAGLDALS